MLMISIIITLWQGKAQNSNGKKVYIVCYKERINSGK